jgi:hypothetical protein
MTKNEMFLRSIAALQRECYEIAKSKNGDYANVGDPFANFMATASMAGVDTAHGIMVRMTDKMIRAKNLLEREAQCKDEKIEDTLKDLANYALILCVWLRWSQQDEMAEIGDNVDGWPDIVKRSCEDGCELRDDYQEECLKEEAREKAWQQARAWAMSKEDKDKDAALLIARRHFGT